MLIFTRFIDSIGQILEHLFDIGAVFGRYEIMRGVVLLGESLSLFIIDDSEIFKIGLVAGDGDDDFGGGVFFKFLDPLFDSLKGLMGDYLVGDDGAEGIFIVDGCDGVILLLSGGVLGLGIRYPDSDLD